jgi:NAD(P)-dependent dehydrogenase (short-subunit alcohol dehydrogenase family)
MRKTVLITGSSTGIGRSVAEYFVAKGWNVAATMRTPDKATDFVKSDNLKLYALDVTDVNSIKKAIYLAMQDFGNIDVVVNNAGYGAVGIFEKASPEEIQKQFDTNVFGVMNVIREILPHFRERKKGTIVNITSMGGLLTFPLYSLYHGTKWALEGFGESLQYELKPFNIRIKNVEPGAIKTDFYNRSMNVFKDPSITDYDHYEKIVFNNTQATEKNAPGPLVVAKAVFKAANSTSYKLRYPVGGQGPMLLFIRRTIPLSWYRGIVKMVTEKGMKK